MAAGLFALMVGVIAAWPQCSGMNEGTPTSPNGPPAARPFCEYASLMRNAERRFVGLDSR
jgi:hypothetical protein